MQDVLKRILEEYLIEKTKTFASNLLAEFIRGDAVNTIVSEASINTNYYKVKGSAGDGSWAEVPWIAILDRQITKTAQQGYCVIYLFRKDMSGVYLSLDMSWNFFKKEFGVKKGRLKIREIANILKTIVKSKSILGFNTAEIDLRSENTLAVGYELGHICGKFYPKNELPSDINLRKDLLELMMVYGELKWSSEVGNFRDIVKKRSENTLPYTNNRIKKKNR